MGARIACSKPVENRNSRGQGVVQANGEIAPETLLDVALKLAARIAANLGHQLRMAKPLIREAQASRLETILQMSAAFQALAHSTQEHPALIAPAVARLSKKES